MTSYYAELDNNKNVIRVIVADIDFINTLPNSQNFIETDRDTRNNVNSEGKTPLRGNSANIGDHYDTVKDIFYRQKPFPSWTFDNSKLDWKAPKEYPVITDEFTSYKWNESSQEWDLQEYVF
jgi:hypothetical protein